MSFNDEYMKLRKKRLNGEETPSTAKDLETPRLLYQDKTIGGFAPVDDEDDIAPVKPTVEKEDKRKWFQKSALFEDGYQFGDVFRTIEGTARDLEENVMAGILGIGESVVDAGAFIAGGVGGLFGADEFAKKTKDFIASDLYDEKEVAKNIVGARNISSLWADSDNSVLGDKADSVAQSGGQLLGTLGLQAVGVPWFLTTGVTSFGGEVENAFDQGANYAEAGLSGAITAGAEILTEKISGGINFGAGTLDDALTKKLATGISNKALRTMAKLGMDVVGEGSEEVVSQVLSNLGSSLYREENLNDILFSEEAMDEYLESFIGGAILGGVGSGSRAVRSAVSGVDATTGLTANEETVFKKVYNDLIAEAESDGKTLTRKEKSEIYDNVMNALERGEIDIDDIEAALGGDTYKAYRDTVDSEDALQKEFDELGALKKSDLTVKQDDRYNELKQLLADAKTKNAREQIKAKLSDEVFNLAKDSKLAESYNEKARRSQAFEDDLSQYDEGMRETVKKAVDSGILNNTRRTHEFVKVVAKIAADKGVLFDFTNNAKLKESGFAIDGADVNGYVTKDGVTLNIDSHKAWQSTVGHEITHVLEGTELYTELQTALFEYAKSKNDYQGRYDSLTKLYKNVEGANVDAELTADLVGDYLFTDEDFVNNLSVTHRNVFQKIYDEIKYLWKVATAGSKEKRDLERVKRAFDKAYKEGGKAQGDPQYSLTGKNKDGIEVYETSQSVMDLSWTERKAKYLDVMKNEYRGRTAKFERNGHTYYAEFDQGSIRKPIYGDNRSSPDGAKALIKAGADGDVFDLVENSQYRRSRPNTKDHTDADYFDYFVKTVQIDGKVFDLVADVEKKYGVEGGYVYTLALADNKRIKASPAHGTPKTEPVKNAGNAFSNGIVPQNSKKSSGSTKFSLSDSDGKQLTKEQSEYFKDSKVRDENGNLKVMYHGTPNGDFSVFKEGTYFTENKWYAALYQNPGASSIRTGKVASNPKTFEVYLDIKKPFDLNDAEARNIYINDYIKGGNAVGINPYLSDAEYRKIKTIDWTEGEDLREFLIDNGYDYDGLVLDEGAVGGYGEDVKDRGKSYVVFSPEQVKNVDNLKPTRNTDIRYSLTEYTEEEKKSHNKAVLDHFGRTFKWAETGYLLLDGSKLDLSGKHDGAPGGYRTVDHRDITDALGYDYGDGDYSGSLVQFMSEGNIRIVPEIDGINLSVKPTKAQEQALSDFISRARGEVVLDIDDLNGNTVVSVEYPRGTYHAKVLNDIREWFDNGKQPETSGLSSFRSLTKKGDQQKRYGNYSTPLRDLRLEKASTQEDIAPVAEEAAPVEETVADILPDDVAPISEEEANAMQNERIASLDDADAPPETEAPYYGESEDATPDDPFAERDYKDVGNRSVNAYMYENPEVKPFFQKEAGYMLKELYDTQKGERYYTEVDGGVPGAYGADSFGVWSGSSRHTTADIAYLLDNGRGTGKGYTYDEIEKGLKAIIEDNGKENNACSKRIEFLLNDRLLNGYQDILGYDIPADQEYTNLLNEKQISEYSDEARKRFFDVADEYAPPEEDIAPVAESKIAPEKAYEAIRPKQEVNKEPRMKRIKEGEDIAPTATFETAKRGQIDGQRTMFAEGKTAKVLTEEPETNKKKRSAWSMVKNNVLDKGMVFEDLSLKTGNRELQARWHTIRNAEKAAQRFMENGNASVSSLKSIRETVEKSGKTEQFYNYLYHKHNVDRMSLERKAEPIIAGLWSKFSKLKESQIKAIAAQKITETTTEKTAQTIREAREYLNALGVKNKPVFGDSVTAEVSQEEAAKLEKANPEFKEYAKEVYDYMNHLRGMLVDSGVISNETAKLWADMYPNYVPIRRAGDEGLNINVPLDTGRTGVNAPIKRATGGNRDILPLFDTIGQRTIQTYKAIAKNRFGVELKNTLGTTIANEDASVDDAIDSVDAHDGLLQEGRDGNNPTFTVFENGQKVTFEITEEMYDAIKPTSKGLSYTNKALNKVSEVFRGLLTEYNPVFMATNAVKDVQDILINSQHAAKTYAAIPKAVKQMATKGHWYQEYLDNGGEGVTYFDKDTNTFKAEDKANKSVFGMPLRWISTLNNTIEKLPRVAEYIASREEGRSIDVSMLDAARVTTNFAAGGDLTKFLNRNGATFLNASMQGAMQQVRNVREAKANGLKGWLNLATKVAIAGIPALILNNMIWDDDEEYEELSDYVKDNYYIVAKYGDGKFVRIPKGRTLAVIQDALEQVSNAATGNDEVDLRNFLDLAFTNLAPNNPLDNNILAPIMQVKNNETWYGEDLVPTRLQDLPAAEQYDESTDSISKWLGEKLNVSPYKLNYLLNQYTGGVGDVVLPMITPEAEGGEDNLAGKLLAPWRDKFTTDSVLNNQNVSDFYDKVDELTANAKSSYATDEDILMSKYMNSISSKIGDLYKEKREIQNSDLTDSEKYEAVRELQDEINALARESLGAYENVYIDDGYATVGNINYRLNDKGEWTKISEKQYAQQEDVVNGLGIDPSEYWSNKTEYDFAYEYPEKYAVAKSVGGFDAYKSYTSELYDISADKDEDGKSIRGSRKEKVIEYINNLDADYGEKIILFKHEYNADDTYNEEIIEYLNGRNDISYEEMETILKELGFTVHSDGRVTWD